MELDYKAIGRRIKIARIKAEMTQEKLCEIIDLSNSHMSNIETGTTKASLKTLISIANALGVTLDDLVYDNLIHAPVQLQAEMQQILDLCDPYEKRIIIESSRAVLEALRHNKALKNE